MSMRDAKVDGRRGRAALLGAIIAAGISLGAGAIVIGQRLLVERRSLLLRALEGDLRSTLNTLSELLSERARDIRSDLAVVVALSQQGSPRDPTITEIVRSNLIALDRSSKNYVRFWYLLDGEVLADVSGFRAYDFPIPNVDVASVARLAERAAANPGSVVTSTVVGSSEEDAPRLRLFAMGSRAHGGCIAILTNLDALFEVLQRRARLPGTEVWVLDAELGVLVDPVKDLSHRTTSAVEMIRRGGEHGMEVLGPAPSLSPFSSDGVDSRMIAWSATAIDGVRWSIGVAVPLTVPVNQLRELSQRLLFFAAIAVLLIGAIAFSVVLYQRRQLERAERNQYAATVGRLRDQLIRAEKLSMIGQLASGVAHEIGTPLGVIAIRVDQLLAQLEAEKARSALSIVKHEIARINRILQQLLDFSRPRQSVARAVPLHASVARVRLLLEHRFDQKDVELMTDVDEDLTLRADPDQLEQVLLNLLLNACDACRAHDSVHVRARSGTTREDYVDIEIRDTGTGIEDHVLEHIFDPFFTTKIHGEGTGLGLTVAREIVERHGGRISVSSGKSGTTFSICWPEITRANGESRGEVNG